MHIDELVIEVDVGILIRRGKEEVVDEEGRVLRDLPGEVDRMCAGRDGRRGRVVILFPVKVLGTKADDVLVRKGSFADGVHRPLLDVCCFGQGLPRE